jgi:hypothetical protein
MHSLKEKNNDRKDVIGYVEGRCLKCGVALYIVKKWHHYYCNNYCCSPCCPDGANVPCFKERIESLGGGGLMEKTLKEKMKQHILKFKRKQLDIRQKWSDVNGK